MFPSVFTDSTFKKGKRLRRTFLTANTPPYGQPQNGQPQYNQPPQPQAPNYSQPQPGGPQYGQPQPMAIRPAAAIRTTATLWTASAADAAVWSAAADAVRSARHAPAHRVSTRRFHSLRCHNMPNRNNTVSRNRQCPATFLPSKPAPRPKISRRSPLSSARWPQSSSSRWQRCSSLRIASAVPITRKRWSKRRRWKAAIQPSMRNSARRRAQRTTIHLRL